MNGSETRLYLNPPTIRQGDRPYTGSDHRDYPFSLYPSQTSGRGRDGGEDGLVPGPTGRGSRDPPPPLEITRRRPTDTPFDSLVGDSKTSGLTGHGPGVETGTVYQG